MSAEGCIGVTKIGTSDENFDNVYRLDSIDVRYDPPTNQTIYKVRDITITVIHNIQQRSQAYVREHMVVGYTTGNRTGANIEVRCNIDTGAGANGMPISFQEVVSSSV